MSNSSYSAYHNDGDSGIAWMDELQRRRLAGPRLGGVSFDSTSRATATICVHAGTYEDPVTGAVGTPIFQTTTFHFAQKSYDAFVEGYTRDIAIYTRYGNPSQWAVQQKIAALESAQSALVFASGMAAISTTLLALTNNGGHIISSHDVYGGTYNLLREDMHQFGRSVSFVDATDIDNIAAEIRENTQILFFETLSNPLLKAIPLEAIVNLARRHRLLLVVDNTFLSPALMQPLKYGADIVIHSCTKYLNGHSDVTAGVASGARKYIDRIWGQMLKLGGSLEPITAFLLERGIKTLDLRMKQHCIGAEKIAAALSTHPRIRQVYHPSLPDYPYPWINHYCESGYGGMVSFEVDGDDQTALQLMEFLTIPRMATSLGGVESLVSLPFNTSHSSLTKAQRESIGIRPGLVRLSVGIEDYKDLIDDLYQALDRLTV
jgi:cystathionine beta-lyase/cystathionine gamma-synthase